MATSSPFPVDAVVAVRAAWLAVPREAPVDHVPGARHLLGAIAPDAPLHVVHWA